MSAIIGLIAVALVTRVAVPAGVKAISKAINSIQGRLGSGTDFAFGNSASLGSATGIDSIRSVAQIRSEFPPVAYDFKGTGDIEQAKEQILSNLVSQPLVTADTGEINERIAALKNASSFATVEKAGHELTEFVYDFHQRFFADAIIAACERASVKMGFDKIESLASPLGSGLIRFAATDAAGGTIVTEIDAAWDRDLKIVTEVVGVSDNSCHKILDEFHTALEAEGVALAQPPKRAATGGVCSSSAARTFLQKKLLPGTAAGAGSDRAGTSRANEEQSRTKTNRLSQNRKNKIQAG